jgi:hypothetical protein
MKFEHKKKTTPRKYTAEFCAGAKIPELTAEKAKLKIKTIRAGNSAQLIKSESFVFQIHDI